MKMLMQEAAQLRVTECETELQKIQEALDALYNQQNNSFSDHDNANKQQMGRLSDTDADIEILFSSDSEDEDALVNRIAFTIDCSDDEPTR